MLPYVDLDGVLVDFYSAIPEGIRHNWDLTAEYFSHTDEEWWANLPLMPDAEDIMTVIRRHFGRVNMCLLTGLPPMRHTYDHSNDSRIAAGKIRWVQKHYPELMRRVFVGGDKYLAASDRHILIDDDENNVESFRKEGGRAILLPRPWNKNSKFETVPYLDSVLSAVSHRRVA